jgi:hypothetical protein
MDRLRKWLVVLAGCKAASVGVQGPAPSASASAIPSVAVVDAAPAPAPLAPLRWGTRPDPKAALAYVADGYCVGMDVDLLPEATIVRSGRGDSSTIALAEDRGLARWDELSKLTVGSFFGRFTEVLGHWPDGVYVQVNDGGRANDVFQIGRFENGTWKYVFATQPNGDPAHQYVHPIAFGGGIVAQQLTCPNGECRSFTGPLVATTGTAPPIAGDAFEVFTMKTFASGELYAFGRVCGANFQECTLQARRFTPGTKVAVDVLSPQGSYARLSVAARDPGDVWIAAEESVLSHFDGKTWTKIAAPFKGPIEVYAAPDGEVWLAGDQKISRRAKDGTTTDASLPRRRAFGTYGIHTIDGIEVGTPWAALDDGSVVRWDGAWKPVELPRSPFAWIDSKTNVPKAEGVRVRSKTDAWVDAKYQEWPSHYAAQIYEERRALLRTIAPEETFRCKSRGTRWMSLKDDRGFESWPASATADCKTPLVLVAAVEPKTKTDWAKSRSLFKGKPEIEGTTLVEFTVGDRKFLGARPPSFEIGKKVLEIVGKGLLYSAPEMVCADPETTMPVSP